MIDSENKKGTLIAEGKTKKIFQSDDKDLAIVEYKNTITAFDDPKYTKEFLTKAKHSNMTTCGVFEILKQNGLPVAYVSKIDGTSFLSLRCEMIPLEVVARRYAIGSFLKRNPSLAKSVEEIPHRFDEPLVEFFLKTTHGSLNFRGAELVSGLEPLRGEEDPFIANPESYEWKLYHSKLPASDQNAFLNKILSASKIVDENTILQIKEIATKAFLILEEFFEEKNFHLIDFKLEFGVSARGEIVIADVIDNDSWRLRDKDWKDVSKQSFRDGGALEDIENKYALVAKLFDRI